MSIVYSSKGFPQMELFSVVVHKPTGKPLNLYGSISIESYRMCRQSIYKREREDPECLPSESKRFLLLLDGAPQFISCGSHYTFFVDLKHRVNENNESFDEELCKGTIDMDYGFKGVMKFNELLNFRVDGKGCSVEVGIGFYERAAIARVTATLINLKMKDIKVYGQITSQTSLILNASKDLFNKKAKDSIMVHEHDRSAVLELPGSLVAAPLDSELTICADLYVCFDDRVGMLLASGNAVFYVKKFGMSVGVIPGNGCDIQVEVDWLYF